MSLWRTTMFSRIRTIPTLTLSTNYLCLSKTYPTLLKTVILPPSQRGFTCTSTRMAAQAGGASQKYPTHEEIREMFAGLEHREPAKFFEHVVDNVDWTVMGTHPLGGNYKSVESFQKGTLARLAAIFKDPGLSLKVRNIIGGGDEAWAAVELIGIAECKNGLPFENTYCWNCRFDEDRKIVQVRAYLDSELVRQAIVENECPSQRAPVE